MERSRVGQIIRIKPKFEPKKGDKPIKKGWLRDRGNRNQCSGGGGLSTWKYQFSYARSL